MKFNPREIAASTPLRFVSSQWQLFIIFNHQLSIFTYSRYTLSEL